MTIGIVVFSFALRSEWEEPNPCNIRLGEEAERAIDWARDQGLNNVCVAQWETHVQLDRDGYDIDHAVYPAEDGSYLDSRGVWEAAKGDFAYYEGQSDIQITEVLVVANPFLHLTKCKQMIRADGYTVIDFEINWVGFDRNKQNTQWWTRGPMHLILYGIMQKLFGYSGHGGRQNKSK